MAAVPPIIKAALLYSLFEQRLRRIQNAAEAGVFRGLIGLEKEGLRVSREGVISRQDHPRSLGAPLTNAFITTDYSEALLEFVTPAFGEIEAALAFLCDAHRFVYGALEEEILWSASMPCVLEGERSIRIARYGDSNPGRMKTVYRRGLGHRYGRVMQVIAGVHFNYSFSDAFWDAYRRIEDPRAEPRAFSDRAYMALVRNLQRYGWLIPYLFGASPAVCKSFVGGRPTSLEPFDRGTLYEPYATSLRMGDIGYTNRKEKGVGIRACYDDLPAYLHSLRAAIETPCPQWQRLGVKVDGRYEQLNANILQIENEYYSTVRPKQILQGLEKPTTALHKRGIRYVELRSLDLNSYQPLGISAEQGRFIEAFMLFCLLQDSPPISDLEREEIDRNLTDAAHRGRDPRLLLKRQGRSLGLREWGGEICDALAPVCRLLDGGAEDGPYAGALRQQRGAVEDPDLTPSARMLATMADNQEGFFQFAWRMSHKHKTYFDNLPPDPERSRLFEQEAQRSVAELAAIEAREESPFDQFLADYFAAG